MMTLIAPQVINCAYLCICAEGLIQLSEDLNTSIICVGPGTSVTLMRSVIEERVDAGSNGTDLLCTISDQL